MPPVVGVMQHFQTSIQTHEEGRMAPALFGLEKNSRQLNAKSAAKAGQTSDRESEERQRRSAIRNISKGERAPSE